MVQADGQQLVVDVGKQFQELTADVISHALFGRDYAEVKEVFLAQKELEVLFFATVSNISIPGFKYIYIYPVCFINVPFLVLFPINYSSLLI